MAEGVTVDPGFGLYVHWPYCGRICPYCDFNVYRARGADTGFLLDAICADIVAHRDRLGPRTLDTVFFGGGTPGLLSGAEVARVLGAADHAFGLAADAEISLEANPEDRDRFADHVAAGINRLSVGVQALDDGALAALGRNHDAAAAVAAVEAAAATSARVSLDLIYARPGQEGDAWEAELIAALALPAEHVSLYQLTIEAGTAFDRAVRRGRLAPPPSDVAAALYERTQEVTARHGAPAYEISNHARGEGARSRHNLLYWRGGDWIGVGPGAHGRLTLTAARWGTQAHDTPRDYAAAVAANGVGWAHAETLTAAETDAEIVLMGLRLVEGVPRARMGPVNEAALTTYAAEGLLAVDAARVALTARGRLFADRIAAELLCD